MSTNFYANEVEVREQRLGTIKSYMGTGTDLTRQGCAGCLKDGKRCFNSTAYCSHTTALLDISVILDVVLIDHGPVGCSSGIVNWNVNFQFLAQFSGISSCRIKVISTNLNESDTILGATEKLKDAVALAYKRYKPAAIFILSTCVSSIIGEDINGVVGDLEKEVGIPVGFVGCAGLRSHIWATGFDASKHAIINTLLRNKPPSPQKSNLVNYIDFFAQSRPVVERYLAAIDLEPRYFCAYSKVEDYDHIHEAVATTGICSVLSSYLAAYLEEKYQIPYMKESFGLAGVDSFKKWYLDIARVVGREKDALDFFNADSEKYTNTIAELKKRLKGVRAVISLGQGFAFDVARLVGEFGVDVVHVNAHHFDPVFDAFVGDAHTRFESDVETSISDIQHYETYKLLQKHRPDIYIGRVHAGQNYAFPLGIPSISLSGADTFGFDGIVAAGNLILENLGNKNMFKKISARVQSGFSKQFEDSKVFSLIEVE